MFFSALTPKQKGPSWLLWMAIATVGVGIILRFSGLSERVYWIDEVATSIRVAGYSFQEVAQTLYQGQPLTPETILRFVSPAPDRSVGEMLHSLGIEDSQHPPLYYFLTFFWMRLVGHSPAAMRSFSAILSVVAIPLLFWLCWELFASLPIALTAIALNAVSFMPISYAHEARQYSLWIVILLLMQISLWRYGKTGSRGSLCGYVMASGMGLNTFPVTILVIFSHGLYLMLRDRGRFSPIVRDFLLGTAIAVLMFTPWLWVMATNATEISQTTTWMQQEHSPLSLLGIWLINLSQSFIGHPSKFSWPLILVMAIALVQLVRQERREVWLFLISTLLVNGVAFSLADLFFQTSFSFHGRYLWPYLLCSQVVLAYFLGTLLSPSSRAPRWQAPFGMALLCGILLACFIKSGLTVKRYGESPILAAAAIINQVPNPIVFNSLFANPVLRFEQVDNTAIGDIFSLSYHLNPDVILQLVPNLSALGTKTINPGDFLFFVSHSPENAIHATTLTGVKAFFKPIDIANSEKTILFQADSNVSE